MGLGLGSGCQPIDFFSPFFADVVIKVIVPISTEAVSPSTSFEPMASDVGLHPQICHFCSVS